MIFDSQGYVGEEQLADALKGADIVIIPAGVPRKPGMTRDDLFNVSHSGLGASEIVAACQALVRNLQPSLCGLPAVMALHETSHADGSPDLRLALRQINAGIVKGLIEATAKHAPEVRLRTLPSVWVIVTSRRARIAAGECSHAMAHCC